MDIYCHFLYNTARGDLMLANFEKRNYEDHCHIWIGGYRNLHNLAHWHMETELIYIEQGQAIISHNDEEYHLRSGDLIYINSGQIHYINCDQDCIVKIIMFHGDFLPEALQDVYTKDAVLKSAYHFLDIFSSIQYELKHKHAFYIERCHNLLEQLLIEIYRKENIDKFYAINKNVNLMDYKGLLSEIQKNYTDITFSQAASYMGLSESYFSKYFHKLSGMTFSRYLNIIRIEKAISLLKEKAFTVTEISYQCGFETIRHFNRVFKEITGYTPKNMPKNFVLNQHTTKMFETNFDPTLKESVLLK